MPADPRRKTATQNERRPLALTTSQEGARNDGISRTNTLASILADGINRRQVGIPAVSSAAVHLARTPGAFTADRAPNGAVQHDDAQHSRLAFLLHQEPAQLTDAIAIPPVAIAFATEREKGQVVG